MTKTIEISEQEYARLKLYEEYTRALQSGGVDNWEWYCESLEDAGWYNSVEEYEEKFDVDFT